MSTADYIENPKFLKAFSKGLDLQCKYNMIYI